MITVQSSGAQRPFDHPVQDGTYLQAGLQKYHIQLLTEVTQSSQMD